MSERKLTEEEIQQLSLFTIKYCFENKIIEYVEKNVTQMVNIAEDIFKKYKLTHSYLTTMNEVYSK